MGNKKKRHSQQQSAGTARPLISVCMIVKDEEANLERCLNSVRPIADEIIVVDTGSTDRTVEIARQYGARVSSFQWCDDFAAARNAALDQARGAWVLQIDADEELTPEAIRNMRRVVENAPSRCWGYHIPERVHYIRDRVPALNLAYRLLLFRNHPHLRYYSRIHEHIRYTGPSPELEFPFVDDLVLDHHGYVADEAELRKKQERNQRLLEAAIAAEPEEPFHYFNLGKHYYGTGRIAEAAEPLRRAVALCISDSASYLVNAYAMLVVALGQGGRGEEVEATLAEAERRLPTLTADFLCNAGSAYQATGKLEQALVYFQRAIDAGGARTACGSDPATHTWRPRFGIGIINEALGNLEGAQASYEEALTYFPTSPLLHCRMAKVAARMGQPEKALQLIERALQSGVVPTELLIEMLQVCEALAEAGSARQSATPGLEEVGGQLVQRIQPAPEYGAALAAACSRFGQYERGIAAASATLERREDVLARVNRGFCYFALGRYQEASEDFSAALAMKPDDPRVLADLSAALQRLEGVQTPGAGVPAGSASERPLSESEAGAEQAKGAAVPVSIIIPVFNKVEATRRCIEAIVGNTPDDLYEAIVVDDGSTDGTKDFLGLLAGDVEVITNEKNCGYYQACRQGSQKARGKYLVFLSNEAEPRPGWLESSVALAESDGSIGAVGAKLVYPDGTLDEAGAIAFSDGATWQYGRGMDPADPQLSFVREVDYCSAVGLLVRRDLWDGIGGFSLQFAPTDYEAADLCFAIRRAGYKVVYQPAASVVHHKEASARAG